MAVILAVGVAVALLVGLAAFVMLMTRSDEGVATAPEPTAQPQAVAHAPEPEAAPKPRPQRSASSPRKSAAPAAPVELVGQTWIAPGGRSPIPQPGETITALVPPVRLDAQGQPVAPPASDEIIPWHEAGRHVGHVVTVEGTIIRAHNTGKVCFLNFVPEHPSNAFYLIVFESLLNAWPAPPEEHFLNRTVRVTGKVFEHRGKPQLRIENQDQITIVQ